MLGVMVVDDTDGAYSLFIYHEYKLIIFHIIRTHQKQRWFSGQCHYMKIYNIYTSYLILSYEANDNEMFNKENSAISLCFHCDTFPLSLEKEIKTI